MGYIFLPFSYIAKYIHTIFKDQSYEELLDDVNTVIADIENSEFMTADDDQRGFINLIDIESQIDSAIFEITKRCNLECKHCWEGGSHSTEELSTKEIISLIDELSMLKVFKIVITGGEPLLREDLSEILKRCTEKNIRVTVFTNGTLISEEFLDKIKECNVLIRFSIDGAKAETHDYLRGVGNFNTTIKAMKLCKEKGLDIGLACTITKKNFHEYNDILELGKELGVKEIELSEVIDKGNATLNKDLMLDQSELEQLRVYNLLVSAKNESFRAGMGFDKENENKFGNEEVIREYSCTAAISNCFISAKGEVYPCTLFKTYKEFCGGNIKENKLSDFWQNAEAFKKLRDLKINKINSCVTCESFKFCPGGCRAKAYELTGQLNGPMTDEFCITSKNMLNRIKSGEFYK